MYVTLYYFYSLFLLCLLQTIFILCFFVLSCSVILYYGIVKEEIKLKTTELQSQFDQEKLEIEKNKKEQISTIEKEWENKLKTMEHDYKNVNIKSFH